MTPSDVKIVADNIEDFAEVPDGIERLRKAVLTLAVSGKLVPQSESEGTAEELYNQIQLERVKDTQGKTKKTKELPEITEEEIPFEIPKSWKWVRLGNICDFIYGDALPKESRVTDGKYKAYGANGPLGLTNISNCGDGGIIIGRKGTAGAVNLTEEPFFATDVTYFIPKDQYNAFDIKYLFYLLKAIDLPKYAKGIKPGINRNEVYILPIALPPIGEQKRVVKKIETVLTQLDELEVKKKERDETRIRLARSAMQSLGKGGSKIAFEQLTELIKTPTDIKELENALFALAVSGKLVPQDESEGTAEMLYNQIQLERTKNAEGKKKKTKELPEIIEEEIPFEIPKLWKWVRVREITHDCGQKTPNEEFYYVDVSSISSSQGKIISPRLLTPKEAPSRARKCVEDKSVIYSSVRPYLLNTAVIDLSLLNKEVIVSTAFFVLKPYLDISSDYIHLVIRSSFFTHLVNNACVGAAYPAINDDKFEKIIIPLPPIQEQLRIVKKVEEIMILINNLKQII